ncbi:MAG: transcriptional repressor LexA [Bacilli bacterium]
MEKLTSRQDQILSVVKKFIAKHGYSPSIREIGEIIGLSSTATVYTHLQHLISKGYLHQTEFKSRTLEVLVPNEYLEKDENIVTVPLLGKITAGNPIEAIEHPDEYVSLPSYMIPKNSEIFSLNVEGMSMKNIGIYDKDILVVRRTSSAKNGDVVVALNEEGYTTVKTFYKENGYYRLQPENETMNPIILDKVNILGIVAGLYRKY